MTGTIFINYRRALSAKEAQLLHTHLRRHLPAERLFIDLKGLDGKSDWYHELTTQVSSTAVMLALIGHGWSDVLAEDGTTRRLDLSSDFVRTEIREALNRRIPVLPVLVDGASMPSLRELPEDLWWLTRGPQAAKFRPLTGDADVDADRIADQIETLLAERGQKAPPRRSWLVSGTAAAAFVLSGAAGVVAGPYLLAQAGLPYLGVHVTTVEALQTLEARLVLEKRRRELAEVEALKQGEAAARLSPIEKALTDAEAAAKAARADLAKATDAASVEAKAKAEALAARDTARADAADARKRIATAEAALKAEQAKAVESSVSETVAKNAETKAKTERDAARAQVAESQKKLAEAEAAAKAVRADLAKATDVVSAEAKGKTEALTARDAARSEASELRKKLAAAEAALKVEQAKVAEITVAEGIAKNAESKAKRDLDAARIKIPELQKKLAEAEAALAKERAGSTDAQKKPEPKAEDPHNCSVESRVIPGVTEDHPINKWPGEYPCSLDIGFRVEKGTSKISKVLRGSDAESKGLAVGDSIVAVNDVKVETPQQIDDVLNVARETRKASVRVTIARGQGNRIVIVRFGEAPI